MKLEIKICGIKDNAREVAGLQPDYMGFIFHPPSPRSVHDGFPEFVNTGTKKVGVFVNRLLEEVKQLIDEHGLDIVQLHGDESPEYCAALFDEIEVWKVFSVGADLHLTQMEPYSEVTHRFLFDTKGMNRGGNGTRFDWSLLETYPFSNEFVLSGGIGPEALDDIIELASKNDKLVAVDLNSRFESKPGLKDIETLTRFIYELSR